MKTLNTETTRKFMAKNPTVLAETENYRGQKLTYYEHPVYGEDDTVYVMIDGILADTGFYDVEQPVDYEPTLVDGQIYMLFELESN